MRNLIATAVLMVAACGGADSLAIDGYPDAVRDALCRNLAKCGDVESAEVCSRVNLGFIVHLSASEQAAIAMAQIAFHGDQAQRCLDALADRSCDVTSQSSRVSPPACDGLFVGTVHANAACALDAECISQFCAVPSCDDACCQGTCIGDRLPVRGAVGDSCEDTDCDDQAFCDFDTALCIALQPANASCTTPQECDFGLYCMPDGTCQALPALGAPCDGPCRDDGATCSPTTGTCVQVALEGEACASSADCSILYTCDQTKHCSAGLALGAACTISQRCAGDLAYCDTPIDDTTGTCALPKPSGEPCTRNTGCQSVYCDPVSLTCADEPVCF